MRSYQIYPPNIVAGVVCSASGIVQPGCTIVQTARLGPMRIKTAVRVIEVHEDPTPGRREYSYSYVTLKGHPEEGLIRFRLKEEPDGTTWFRVDAWSRPGAWWSKLGRPFASAWQRRANQNAVEHVTRAADVRR